MITVKILADSETPLGNRLTTFELTYPRFVHSEFLTHRCFSRNAASSRAIPIEKMIEAVMSNPAMPEFWGKNQKGMQAIEQLVDEDDESGGVSYGINYAKSQWLEAKEDALYYCDALNEGDVHKQIANRVIEPFSHITVIATSSEAGLRNFFALRANRDAQPEFQVLAFRMLNEYMNSKPKTLGWDQWHIPYDIKGEVTTEDFTDATRLKVATGRIARVSYLTHDGVRDPSKDIELHDRLKESGHWSPFEHCAQASPCARIGASNFGPYWHQYRKEFHQEMKRLEDKDLLELLANKPSWFEL